MANVQFDPASDVTLVTLSEAQKVWCVNSHSLTILPFFRLWWAPNTYGGECSPLQGCRLPVDITLGDDRDEPSPARALALLLQVFHLQCKCTPRTLKKLHAINTQALGPWLDQYAKWGKIAGDK